jgi:hypothetical protein
MSSQEELIAIIGQLNSEIFNLRARIESLEQQQPNSDESSIEFLEAERRAHREANESEISRLQSIIDESTRELEEHRRIRAALEREKGELKSQNVDLRQLIREQQDADRRLEPKPSPGHFAARPDDSELLYSRIAALDLELKASRDENALLRQQLQAKDARFHDEIHRLAANLSAPPPPEPARPAAPTPPPPELATMRQTIKSLNDALSNQAAESRRLHRQLVARQEAAKAAVHEESATATHFRTLQALLKCADARQVVVEVERLVAEREDARRSLNERQDLERRIADEVMRNRMLQERMSVAPVEGPTAPLRDDSRILNVCAALGRHFENDFEVPTDLTRAMVGLFARLIAGEAVNDALTELDALVANDTNGIMALLAESFRRTTARLTAQQDILGRIHERANELFRRVAALSDTVRRRRRAWGRSPGRPSRIPTPFSEVGKVRAPLRPKNPHMEQAFSPRHPVELHEPRQVRYT